MLQEVAAELGWKTKNIQMRSEQWISQPDGISSSKWDWSTDGGHTNGGGTWKGGGARTGVWDRKESCGDYRVSWR